MSNLLNVDPKEAEKKLSAFRKYSTEILLLCALSAIWFLFAGQKELEKDLRKYLIEDRLNTSTQLNESTEVLRDIKDILEDNQVILRESKIITQPTKK